MESSLSCSQIQPELVLYHFGTIAPESRMDVESHLLSCRECLAGYLALKRHLESEPDSGPRPGEPARRRLRAAVEQEFGRPRTVVALTWRRAASWGLAAAAAVAIAFVAFQGGHPAHTPKAGADTIPVDSANPGAAGLTVL